MPRYPKTYQKFQQDYSALWEQYTRLGETAAISGPLDPKTRELVKLGMAAAYKSMSAVQSHTHRALEVGASPDEIRHTILLGITTLGFPVMMSALSWVDKAILDHQDS